MIVSSSAIAVDSKDDDRKIELSVQSEVMAITSTESAAKIAEKSGFIRFKSGTITAIPAVLLNGGALTNFDVIVFLTEVLKDVPDIHAAAVISEAVTKLIPVLSCDLASLMVEAQSAESHINSIIKNHNQGRLPYVCH
jgi:predicted ATP-grasp superfamily ATP-dependent carboligase